MLPVFQVVKRIWEYIRAHDLQNPKDRRKIMPDEVLGTILTAPVNMMTMNTQLNKHCFSKGNHVRPCMCLAAPLKAVHACCMRAFKGLGIMMAMHSYLMLIY